MYYRFKPKSERKKKEKKKEDDDDDVRLVIFHLVFLVLSFFLILRKSLKIGREIDLL